MQRTINQLICTLFATAILVSCSSGVSLQTYFVDKQEAKNFISQDVPLSMMKIDQTNFTEAQKDAYNSVSKLNFLGYKADENNAEALKAEIDIVKTILSDAKYNDLVEFSDKGRKILVKYIGTNEEADEVIIFGSSNELGFAVVRVLGNNMSPDKMVNLVGAIQKAGVDESQLNDIMNFFK
ncbi:DUF4252 domain-containing protein [Thalassobellus suaedae]|uniref:DUF4252 domain-containing protein n=1 Tax=Thalassobellus suaedae TaxID=3074124 RepID=A0ABY9XPM1_9FLAO|nr:DUF4252 domain-containing protein [Flavobacteriaceae bacterium HL-DH14]